MTGDLGRRLTRLQVLYAARLGCATCAGWGAALYVYRAEDGHEIGRSRPDTCPTCGRNVPARVVREYVGIDPDSV